ncbi:MAG TPA: DUF937 domain-containing protein [Bacillota bacterium]|nr:DUF937 domain-containing protein [Bacillota bacterium]HNT02529.1 DUF937 domain-containing protein [Bacillota bacterium]HOH89591.1 DUF937 domain-containing protein [Bacillota bacterium]HPA55239.1 DUF937 domain-containing protein [Bacillota bacterium]HQA65770.1 DUF937 domain-containing protein [Bacillota bacterium]
MDIVKLLTNQLNSPDTLKKLAGSVGVESSQAQKLTQLGIPAILQALGRNASTKEGAEALLGALDGHQKDEIEDLTGFLNKVDTNDGAKILQHIFSGNNKRVQENLARQTGLNTSQVSGIMTQLAPLMMGALGKKKKEENLDVSGVVGLLGGLMDGGDNNLMGIVTNLLDSDNDGDVMDNIGDLLGGLFKK